jgi:hypothetical protein
MKDGAVGCNETEIGSKEKNLLSFKREGEWLFSPPSVRRGWWGLKNAHNLKIDNIFFISSALAKKALPLHRNLMDE